MNQEDIIKLAQKWGDWNGQTVEFNDVGLERFFRLAYEVGAAAERQRCAQIARQFDRDHPNTNYGGCIARLIEETNP
jgi:hypothetical protein